MAVECRLGIISNASGECNCTAVNPDLFRQ